MQKLSRNAAALAASLPKRAVTNATLRAVAASVPRRFYFAETLRVKPIHADSRTPDEPFYIQNAHGNTISPWHDIPLRRAGAKNIFNFVCEIPRGSTPKYEVGLTKTPVTFGRS